MNGDPPFAKFQGLYANGMAFNKLSEAQQTVLREAAVVAQKRSIAEHPSDADAGKAYCADGGGIVLASAAQVAAFEQAAQPVIDSLEKDPLNAKLIGAIRDLKAKTITSAGAAACAPLQAQTNATPNPANVTWSRGPLPNGVWTVVYTADDFVQLGDLISTASDYSGKYTLTITNGKLLFTQEMVNGQGQNGKCQGATVVTGDHVELTYIQVTTAADECPGEVDDIQWRLDSQGLHIHLVSVTNNNFHDLAAWWEGKPWQKSK